jgi:hypothetical protein
MPFPMAKGAAWAICSISCCGNRDRHRGCQSARKFEAIGFKTKVEADTWLSNGRRDLGTKVGRSTAAMRRLHRYIGFGLTTAIGPGSFPAAQAY